MQMLAWLWDVSWGRGVYSTVGVGFKRCWCFFHPLVDKLNYCSKKLTKPHDKILDHFFLKTLKQCRKVSIHHKNKMTED